MAVRPGAQEDLPLVKELWKKLFGLHAHWGYAFAVTDEAADEWVRSFAKTLGRFSFLWVAGEEPLTAFLLMRLVFTPPHTGRQTVGQISELFVDESVRGQSLGGQLVQVALAKARELELHSIEVQTMVDNESGQRFWQSQGLSPELIQFRLKL